MKSIKLSFILFILLTLSIGTSAQFRVHHELGGSIGPTLISGDWGKNTELGRVFGYDGVEINFLHNMQIVRSKLGLRSNLGFSYGQNHHKKDEWTGKGEQNPSLEQQKLNAMSGTTMTISLGTQVEYNFLDFGMYYPRNIWTPYVGIGFNILYYSTDVSTPLGIPNVYSEGGGIYSGSDFTSSFKMSAGAKFKFSRFISLFSELTLQRVYSDKLDGLVPNASFGTDYISGLNLGLRYSFR